MSPSIARKILLEHAAGLWEAAMNVEANRATAMELLRGLAEDSEVYVRPHRIPAGDAFAMVARAGAVSTAA